MNFAGLVSTGRPPGPEMEYCTDRESYSLASGLALGMVCLGVSQLQLGNSLSVGIAFQELFHPWLPAACGFFLLEEGTSMLFLPSIL